MLTVYSAMGYNRHSHSFEQSKGGTLYFMAIEVGSKLEGRVTGITHFGAFVELEQGVTGLVHISEIADNYVKDVNDHLKLEDKVLVKVINVDKDGKIGLSIKQTIEKPAEPARPERQGNGKFDSPRSGDRGGFGNRGDRGGRGGGFRNAPGKLSFEDKMNRFLKDSEERISSLKKQDSKRGGRGGRRD